MKKIIAIATALTIAIIATCAIAMTAEAETNDEEFVEIFVVVIDFDYKQDTVDCLDEDGNIWTFFEVDDWIIGNKVVLTVETTTDTIVDLQYIGWMDIFELSHYVIEACD